MPVAAVATALLGGVSEWVGGWEVAGWEFGSNETQNVEWQHEAHSDETECANERWPPWLDQQVGLDCASKDQPMIDHIRSETAETKKIGLAQSLPLARAEHAVSVEE